VRVSFERFDLGPYRDRDLLARFDSRNQIHTTQQKGVEEYHSERGVGLHDAAQIRSVDFKQRTGFQYPDAD
jgi:hypothetical protein